MTLIRYTHPLLGLQQQVNRMFDQFDPDLFGRLENLGEGMFAPAVDVKEDAEAYTVHFEVPGVAQDKLDVSLQDNVLTIRGVKEQKQEQEEVRYRRIERSYGVFARSLSLPRNVDSSGVTAHLEDGVLEVRLPKREEARPRQISVGNVQSAGELSGGGAVDSASSSDVEVSTASSQSGSVGGSTATKAPGAKATKKGAGRKSAKSAGGKKTGRSLEDEPAGNPS